MNLSFDEVSGTVMNLCAQNTTILFSPMTILGQNITKIDMIELCVRLYNVPKLGYHI